MSTRWPGGLINQTAPVPSGPYANSTAPGVWTLEQQAYLKQQGLWPIPGNVNPDAFIENLFQTWLYTGNGGTQNINNGIDLAGKGGLVWIKNRDTTPNGHVLIDSARGTTFALETNTTSAQNTFGSNTMTFNNNGMSFTNPYSGTGDTNLSDLLYCSWTFRKQPKFFDVVTWTGSDSTQAISHLLGSVPGMIIVKRTDGGTNAWQVYHRSLTDGTNTAKDLRLNLNTTGAIATTNAWNNTDPTSTNFTVVGANSNVNAAGMTYVAYLFAHDAGGFGTSGIDNVISCGSYTGNGSSTGPVISLGYEPQYLMVKNSTDGGDWILLDNMRGVVTSGNDAKLAANLSDAESTGTNFLSFTSTGFQPTNNGVSINFSGSTYIYMAIRRPMKVPTTGTEVFSPVARTGTGANATVSSGFVTDTVIEGNRTSTTSATKFGVWDRLRGTRYLLTTSSLTETAGGTTVIQANPWDLMDGYKIGTTSTLTNASGDTFINWMFKRAAGFFDVVCYTGTGSATTQAHNLTVVPELMIVKRRSTTNTGWAVFSSSLGATKYLSLNSNDGEATSSTFWNDTSPTSSLFTVGTSSSVNTGANTYVAYLFATLAGISKVGSYTGNGGTQTINCGFTAGSRFVLIKRTDSTGDWYVWDSARGIVAGNDPYLLLNSTAAEVTGTDYVDTASSGFEISSSAPAGINASGGSYIFLAIA